MYTERQFYAARWLRGVGGFSFGLAIGQTIAFAAAETGRPWLPFGYAAHLGILLLAACTGLFLRQSGLTLRMDTEGLALRFLPWAWRFQHIPWAQIRQMRLLPAGEPVPHAPFGRPAQDITQHYWLSDPHLRVLCVELVNGTRLFVSTEKPAEMLDFLRYMLR